VSQDETSGQEDEPRARGLGRTCQKKERDRNGKAGRARVSSACEVGLGGQQDQREHGRGDHRCGVVHVADQVGAQGEAQPRHVGPDRVRAQPAHIEEDQHPGRRQREEDQRLEGQERGQQGQDGHGGKSAPGR
jgi:hypothetical protein